MEALLKEITKHKRMGYGGLCYDLPKELSEIERQSVIEYVKKTYHTIDVFGDAEDGRLAGYNHKGCYIGDCLSFSWK
jgi:hypothetical protein